MTNTISEHKYVKEAQMKSKTKLLVGIGVVIVIGILTVSLRSVNPSQNEEDIVYRETRVEYGDLTVGITEETTVEIGTLEQRFDLDISALVDGSSTSNSQTIVGAMSGEFGGTRNSNTGMMSFGSLYMDSPASQSQSLEVADVKIAVGQEIKKGICSIH